jgi:peptide subunit release factor 1 (eRF1)
MESRMETMMDLNKNLQGAIDAKERSYALLKEEMLAKLAALTSELSNANVSAATSDQRIDEIRESLREQKVKINVMDEAMSVDPTSSYLMPFAAIEL